MTLSSEQSPQNPHKHAQNAPYPPPPSFAMAKQSLWLRCEKKEFERRTANSPTVAKKQIDANFEIFVERDEQRIFRDQEYEA